MLRLGCGQCTWFAWGRFYEIYGYSPGFVGAGDTCAHELLVAHPDKFEQGDTPVPGSVFSADSAHLHVGIGVGVDGDVITVQEGNLDGPNNPWEEAIHDWHTTTYTLDQMRQYYGNVTYANPKENMSTSNK